MKHDNVELLAAEILLQQLQWMSWQPDLQIFNSNKLRCAFIIKAQSEYGLKCDTLAVYVCKSNYTVWVSSLVANKRENNYLST